MMRCQSAVAISWKRSARRMAATLTSTSSRPKRSTQRGDRGVDGGLVAHVADAASRRRRRWRRSAACELGQRLLLHVDGEQPGALGGQPLGDGAADAGGGAGDEDDTILEAGHGAGP